MSAVNIKILVLSVFVNNYKIEVFILSVLDKICELLKQQGKKQKDLTDYLGITKNSFTDWKSGRIKSYTKHIPKIAEFLGVSTDYLLDVKTIYDFTPPESPPLVFESDIIPPFEIPKNDLITTNNEKKMIMEYRTKPEKQKAINNILKSDTSDDINNETLMFALWGGDTKDITPEMLDDVRRFAQFIREKKKEDTP